MSHWSTSIEEEYSKYAAQVEKQMRELGPDSMTSGYANLNDPWEEFAVQIQEEQSYLWDAYEATVRQICRQLLEDCNPREMAALWSATEEDFEEEDDVIPGIEIMSEAIEEKLFSRVCQRAGATDLEHYFCPPQTESEEEDSEEDCEEEITNQKLKLDDRGQGQMIFD